MKDLQDRQYKNVGVLKFRVKKGTREPSFNVGLLNGNMATRLETALVLVNNEKNPMGITRNASQIVAGKTPKANYLNGKDREGMFGNDFPLAWGKDKVKVDAFLTGQVKINPSTHKTTVIIEAFDRKSDELREVVNFTVPTDRSILADTGESFSLVMRDIATKRGEELEEEAVRDSEERDKGSKKVTAGQDAVENLVDVEVYYDDRKAEISDDRNDKGEKRVAEPRRGTEGAFRTAEPEQRARRRRAASQRRQHAAQGRAREADRPVREVDPGAAQVLHAAGLLPGGWRDGREVQGRVAEHAGRPRSAEAWPHRGGRLPQRRRSGRERRQAQDQPPRTVGQGPHGERPERAEATKLYKAGAEASKKPLIVAGDTEKTKVDELEFKHPVHAGSMTIRYYP